MITSGTASVLLLDGDAPFVFDTSIATAVGPTALLFNRSVVLVAPVGRVAVLDANASAANPRRVLTIVGAGVVVELRGVALTGGFSTECGGGARIEAGAQLRLVQSAVHGCVVRTAGTAAACGGGVLVSGGARLTALGGSRVSNNTAVSVNGQVQGGGLAINPGGTAVLSASAVDSNTARAEGRGNVYGGGVLTFGVLTASGGASISHNTAVSVNGQAQGGGLQIVSGGTAVLTASAVDGNTARDEGSRRFSSFGGGVLTFGTLAASDGASISHNTAVSANGYVYGGGLCIGKGGTAVLSASAVDGNNARAEYRIRRVYGGGVFTDGTLTASNGASISNNTAISVEGNAFGGGLAIGEGGTAVLSASAVDGNTARAEGFKDVFGGGVHTIGALTLSDGASISHNTAVSVKGETASDWSSGMASGGGLSIKKGGTAVLTASAVDGNTARDEGSFGYGVGGGVEAYGALTLSDGASISNNTAVSVNGDAQGGGLFIGSDTDVALSASAVDGNTARAEGNGPALGGGVRTYGALTLSDGTSISHNTAVSHLGFAQGGGVYAVEGSDGVVEKCISAVVLNDSSVLNNTARAEYGARADGGGLATFCNLMARNATIFGNRALAASGTSRGGGLFHAGLPALFHGGVIDGNAAIGGVASGSQVLDWL
jgi:hypothetical protein